MYYNILIANKNTIYIYIYIATTKKHYKTIFIFLGQTVDSVDCIDCRLKTLIY